MSLSGVFGMRRKEEEERSGGDTGRARAYEDYHHHGHVHPWRGKRIMYNFLLCTSFAVDAFRADGKVRFLIIHSPGKGVHLLARRKQRAGREKEESWLYTLVLSFQKEDFR